MSHRLYHCPYPLIGLTGGISTGKSTAAEYLRSLGQTVICADQLIKEIYQQEESRSFLKKHFPECIKGDEIDFAKLRKTAFADPDKLKMLEGLLYPSLEKQFQLHLPKEAEFIFYDVPLLFEKNLQDKFDHICLIYLPQAVQKQRLKMRDQISEEEIDRILIQQWDLEKKRKLADTVIDNSTSLESLKHSLDQLLLRLPALLAKKAGF